MSKSSPFQNESTHLKQICKNVKTNRRERIRISTTFKDIQNWRQSQHSDLQNVTILAKSVHIFYMDNIFLWIVLERYPRGDWTRVILKAWFILNNPRCSARCISRLSGTNLTRVRTFLLGSETLRSEGFFMSVSPVGWRNQTRGKLLKTALLLTWSTRLTLTHK
jgi:hypothetical protein